MSNRRVIGKAIKNLNEVENAAYRAIFYLETLSESMSQEVLKNTPSQGYISHRLSNKSFEQTCRTPSTIPKKTTTSKKTILVIENIPKEISAENFVDELCRQNGISQVDITVLGIRKVNFYDDRCNIVIEVDTRTKRKLLDKRLKLFHSICYADEFHCRQSLKFDRPPPITSNETIQLKSNDSNDSHTEGKHNIKRSLNNFRGDQVQYGFKKAQNQHICRRFRHYQVFVVLF